MISLAHLNSSESKTLWKTLHLHHVIYVMLYAGQLSLSWLNFHVMLYAMSLSADQILGRAMQTIARVWGSRKQKLNAI